MEPVTGMVLLAVGVLLIRVAQALGAMGSARAKNVASAGSRCLADFFVSTIAFWVIGAAILFQSSNPFFAIQFNQLLGGSGITNKWLGFLAMTLLATGNLAPAISERARFCVPLILSALLAGMVVPTISQWTWYGWLSQLGFTDLAGAGAFHLAPALCALVAAKLVGPRDGKFNRDGSANMIPGHSVPMMVVGLFLTLIAWVPYVIYHAETTSRPAVAANVVISAAAGGFVAMLIGLIKFGKTDLMLTIVGTLGGLVAITAPASIVQTPGAFFIGAVAGYLVPWVVLKLDVQYRIDDPAGLIAIHGAGALWSLVAAGVFANGNFMFRLRHTAIQFAGVGSILFITVLLTIAVLMLLRSYASLRVKDADEYDGLDLAEHDINAHPDFQQTMIKSYHLREA